MDHGMKDGIYQVVFNSSGRTGEGMVVIAGNTLNGGGQGYFYQGRLSVKASSLSGKVVLRKWDDQAPPILGLFKEAVMTVTGEYDRERDSFHFEGHAQGHHVIRIQATGRYVAPLTL
jgi:hypothetical protein